MQKNNGFTLVELSIVLVIIGLLIGGILVGQSLIDSAKLNKQVRQFSEFDIVVNAFKSKYRGIPGDSRVFSGGDGDGILEATESVPGSSSFDQEVANFWKNLSEAGLKGENGNYSNLATSGVRAKTHVPKCVLGNANCGVGIRPGNDLGANQFYTFYELVDYTTTTTDATSYGGIGDLVNSGIHPTSALAIDTKLDDGKSNTGKVVMAGIANSCHAFGDYAVTATTSECKPRIRILSASQ